jgi:hypothetical protein
VINEAHPMPDHIKELQNIQRRLRKFITEGDVGDGTCWNTFTIT